jgi:hypothetical protein
MRLCYWVPEEVKAHFHCIKQLCFYMEFLAFFRICFRCLWHAAPLSCVQNFMIIEKDTFYARVLHTLICTDSSYIRYKHKGAKISGPKTYLSP